MYLIFTNKYRHNPNKSVPMMYNRCEVLKCNTKAEARVLVADVQKQGYAVTKITNELGYERSIDNE